MKTLRIVGAGMIGIDQISEEAKEIIRLSNKVLWIGFIQNIENMLLKTNSVALNEDITYLYIDGALDEDNYERIIQKLLHDLSCFKNICLVVPGYPRLGLSFVQKLQIISKDTHQFELKTYSGISSFDSMINELELDPLEEGTCIVDANRLILYDYMMDPALNYFVYHVCAIGNRKTDYSNPVLNNKVCFLKEKLLKHYSATHNIFLVSATVSTNSNIIVLQNSLEKLEFLLSEVSYSHSLFIPCVLPKKENINWQFLKLLRK